MSNRDYPRVCANCKWAEFDADGYRLRCHRYPPTESCYQFDKSIHPAEWCGEFAVAYGLREMRLDLPYPPYQRTVKEANDE